MFGFGRRRDTPRLVDDIRHTIARLDEQRSRAANAAGRALVNQAEVRRACDEQLDTLVAAFDVAEDGELLAKRAAKNARRDADPDADVYERTAAGMAAVQQALGAAARPVQQLQAAADDNAERARAVLTRARGVLDEQIREQLRLLRALEQAERARVVAEVARRRAPES